MMQRKLTDSEVQLVEDARVAIGSMCEWELTAKGHKFWFDVALQLNDMQENNTTDGKPYVEPEPPIPDGYRRAVQGDEWRTDCSYWSDGKKGWAPRAVYGTGFCSKDKYIVPVDRTPTDDDARCRRNVMVRDHDAQDWTKRVLLAVLKNANHKFVTTGTEQTGTNNWRYCRFPYPGEA
jgi:hypothetical protein